MIKQYAFTGDVKKLIPHGFKFQKLYASNYKAYHQDNLFMYVSTKMVLEITNVEHKHQAVLIGFILENKDQPDSFWEQDRSMGKWTMMENQYVMTQFGNVVDNRAWRDLFSASLDRYIDVKDGTEEERHEAIKWKMEQEGGRDPYRLTLERVKQIIELDKVHPLELIVSMWPDPT
jgi:hypothetical protein